MRGENSPRIFLFSSHLTGSASHQPEVDQSHKQLQYV